MFDLSIIPDGFLVESIKYLRANPSYYSLSLTLLHFTTELIKRVGKRDSND